MDQVYSAVEQAAASGMGVVLLSVIAREGSAPRGAGANMAVTGDGKQAGTIGGGPVEYQAKLDALELMKNGGAMIRDYCLFTDANNKDEEDCCGRVKVLFRPFAGEKDARLFRGALQFKAERREAYFVCGITGGVPGETRIVLQHQAESDPALSPHLDGGVVLTDGTAAYFIEPLCGAPRAIVFGGGHVSQKTVPVLAGLGYRVWVVEDRAEFAARALFPEAENVLNDSFEHAPDVLGVTRRDQVIVLARGHETDYRILRKILKTDASYIGCIGSRVKVRRTRERLLADGFSEDDLKRLHSPIGLQIGAETPAEIAVSIAAEMIACRNRKR
jgi:xanthine dehydrogenase accessory factor